MSDNRGTNLKYYFSLAAAGFHDGGRNKRIKPEQYSPEVQQRKIEAAKAKRERRAARNRRANDEKQ